MVTSRLQTAAEDKQMEPFNASTRGPVAEAPVGGLAALPLVVESLAVG